MNYYVGDRVKVYVNHDGAFKFLYDALVVEANDDEARVQVRDRTYGWWYSQTDGRKVGVDNGRFITKKNLKTNPWRSIDDDGAVF